MRQVEAMEFPSMSDMMMRERFSGDSLFMRNNICLRGQEVNA
jgi:hypothetical protein